MNAQTFIAIATPFIAFATFFGGFIISRRSANTADRSALIEGYLKLNESLQNDNRIVRELVITINTNHDTAMNVMVAKLDACYVERQALLTKLREHGINGNGTPKPRTPRRKGPTT